MPDSAYHDQVTPGGYTKGMALNTAIGQGDVNVTPLQLAVLYAAIGNGGKRVPAAGGAAASRRPTASWCRSSGPKLVRRLELSPEQQRASSSTR